MFEVTENTTIRFEVIIAAVYGLRRKEVLGLKLDFINFTRKTITIKHTVQILKINSKTQFVVKDKTKSQSSYRTLPLFDFIEDLLKEYKTIVPIKDIQIWLGHSNIQTTMIYTHLNETDKEVFAQVLVNKFQYILNNYNGNELYDLKENTLNNIYEDIDNSNQYQKWKKLLQPLKFNNNQFLKVFENFIKSVRKK